MLLDDAPDAELWAAAQSNALASEEGVQKQVQRLVALPHVRQRITGLFTTALGADHALTSERDAKDFPKLDLPLRQAMADEIQDLVGANVWGRQPLAELFTSRRAVVSAKLAAVYGASGSPAAPAALDLPRDERSGVLTRAATLLSMPTGSRAVHRGLFIWEKYLCRSVPTPSEQIQVEIGQALMLGLNERQLTDFRASTPRCRACHATFDPLGLAFEHYDPIGRYLSQRDGAAVDASGVLTGTDIDGPFQNVVELSERFAKSTDVAVCLSQQVATLALGRLLEYGERCSVSRVVQAWTRGDKQLGALVSLLTTSRFFSYRGRSD